SVSSAHSRASESRSEGAITVLPLSRERAEKRVDEKSKPPQGGGLASIRRERAYFLVPRPANFFWKRERRPPRSSSCCWPPVHAGCDLGSLSRCSVSPGLPQVVRVVNSLPSVIFTVRV